MLFIRAIVREHGVQRSEMRSDLQFDGSELSRVRSQCLLRQRLDKVVGRVELLGLGQVGRPAPLPGPQIVPSGILFDTHGSVQRVALGRQNPLINRGAMRGRNPRRIDHIRKNGDRIGRRGGKIKKPQRRCRRIMQSLVRILQKFLGTVISVFLEISAQQRVRVRPQLRKCMTASRVLADNSEIRPETLGDGYLIHLLRQQSQRQLPMLDRLGAIALHEISERQAIVRGHAVRIQFQNVKIIGNRSLRIALPGIIVRHLHISRRGGWTLLQRREEKVFRSALFRLGEIFAVTRAVVEPNVAGELLISIQFFSDTLADCFVTQSIQKILVHRRCNFGKIQPCQRIVSAPPNGNARAAARRHSLVGQFRAAIGDDKVRRLLSPRRPIGSKLHKLLGLPLQQQLEIAIQFIAAHETGPNLQEHSQLVFRIVRGAIRTGSINKKRGARRGGNARCELFEARTQVCKFQALALQIGVAPHPRQQQRRRCRQIRCKLVSPLGFQILKPGRLRQRNGEELDIGGTHRCAHFLCKLRESVFFLRREICRHGLSHFRESGRHPELSILHALLLHAFAPFAVRYGGNSLLSDLLFDYREAGGCGR